MHSPAKLAITSNPNNSTMIRQTLTRLPITSAAATRSFTTAAAFEAEARAVERIEDAIHGIIAKRSRPDWLPLVPGASYWVPPRRSSYGVSEIVRHLANALTDEECLSLATPQGWPSSSFYIHNDNDDASSHLDEASGKETSSTKPSLHDDGEAREV